ncbi:MAG: PQQ-binding-like beta-propeller repeat protein [Planctomycetota bacterium]|nr:PQQ-binding-like beta-propeller repeat protein [Planctomycetaceae bacterium]MDQ3331544.1 PQQ-binding-like beta-propeller repeat protein [Planctomycetota bacterium]
MRNIVLLSAWWIALPASSSDWPEFRGPGGQGHSDEAQVPVEWSVDKNIAWQTELPGEGWSSPIVWKGRAYLTAAVPVEGGRPNDRLLIASCLDAADGKVMWRKTVFEQHHDEVDAIHGKNSHATPTPITDGQHLFVHFGAQGTACLSLEGEVIWTTQELRYKPQHGGGGSPVLIDGLVVVNCDGSDIQFVAALDRRTGNMRWKRDRPAIETSKGFSFSTPLVIDVGGRKQIVSPASDQVIAYSSTGDELWRFTYRGYSVVPRPVYGNGLLFISTSFDQPTLYALKLPTQDSSPEVVWSLAKGAPHTPSPLLVGEELYVVSDRGVGTCINSATGEVHWTERLGGNYSSSPIFAGGAIYFQNEDGGTIAIQPGTTYAEVARNSLPGRTLASFAVADSSIFLRTDVHLYRISTK